MISKLTFLLPSPEGIQPVTAAGTKFCCSDFNSHVTFHYIADSSGWVPGLRIIGGKIVSSAARIRSYCTLLLISARPGDSATISIVEMLQTFCQNRITVGKRCFHVHYPNIWIGIQCACFGSDLNSHGKYCVYLVCTRCVAIILGTVFINIVGAEQVSIFISYDE